MNLLVDFNNVFARAFFMANKSEYEEDAAVYHYFNMLLNLIKRFNPDELHVAIDSERSFRKEIYSLYKANRSEKPERYDEQMAKTLGVMLSAGIAVYHSHGFEADDILYTLDKKLKGCYNIIVSGDKDLCQLVSPDTKVWNFKKLMDVPAVMIKFGVWPDQMRDYLALCGDVSDNIPGVKNIGPKRAVELLNTYPSIAEFQKNEGRRSTPLFRKLIKDPNLEISLKLVQLVDVNLEIHFGAYEVKDIHKALRSV
jgi:DNA polymerase I